MAKAPNTKVIDDVGMPLTMYHGTTPEGAYILRNKGVTYKPDGLDMFFTSDYYGQYIGGKYTESVPLYINARKIRLPGTNYEIGEFNPRRFLKEGDDALYEWGFLKNNELASDEAFELAEKEMLAKEIPWAKSKGIDITADEFDAKALARNLQEDINKQGIGHHPVHEFAVPDGKQVKSADAITYDDAGNIIPLSKRDNFNINNIRLGLAPFIVGGTAYGLHKRSLENNGKK